MRVSLEVIGDVREIMEAEATASRRAVTRGIKAAGDGLKADWRGQVEGAGLGSRLARSVRSGVWPKGRESRDAATMVWSRAPRIIDAFERGALIRSSSGFFLAIPTEAAGTKGLGRTRITPGSWEQRTGLKLRFVYRPGKPALLVADGARINVRGRAVMSRAKARRDGMQRGAVTAVIFILVPQVQLRKRLDLFGAADRWAGRVPGLIISNWPRV
jgi:hypothetical protein